LYGSDQGRNQKRLVGGARVKEIERPDQRKLYFFTAQALIFSESWGARAPAGTHLGAAPGSGISWYTNPSCMC
jgi:hypothetical protein